MIFPVILCGGMGTRLWPVSRKSRPKQFAEVFGQGSLFQQCFLRADKLNFETPLILTSEAFRFLVAQQLNEISEKKPNILLEPQPKNTAPSILMACELLVKEDPNAVLLVLPSDHLINDEHAFSEMVKNAFSFVENFQVVVFGVEPDKPETGYGYIKIDSNGKVLNFFEKPDLQQAELMLADGGHYWNSGIFMARADTILQQAEFVCPNLKNKIKQISQRLDKDLDFLRIPFDDWSTIQPASFDKEIVEKINCLSFVPFRGCWTDLGSWSSILQVNERDKNGNYLSGRVSEKRVKNSLILSDDKAPLVVVSDLENVVVVSTPDAVLVSAASESQNIREVVDDLKNKNYPEAEIHHRHFRPWGWFESLFFDQGYQIKRLRVYPSCSLSLQSHKFRSETWVVTEGIATVQVEEKIFNLNINQSVFIEVGEKHRLSNNFEKPLTIIEVQTGSYLGEDDIVRFDDIYERK